MLLAKTAAAHIIKKLKAIYSIEAALTTRQA
jgi:hypothetical protein